MMEEKSNFKVQVLPLNQTLIKADEEGQSESWEYKEKYQTQETYHLCRVVGIHKKSRFVMVLVEKHFTDNEVATKEPYIKQSRGLKVKKLIY